MSHHVANTLAVKLFQKALGYWDGKVDPSVLDRIEFVGGDARVKVPAANGSKYIYLLCAKAGYSIAQTIDTRPLWKLQLLQST